ncbi:MAG: HAMP domain-containing protein [Desulfatibacillum sp.]|nr:HAMP domain-containing protein [Desulfatibacillum sp.]
MTAPEKTPKNIGIGAKILLLPLLGILCIGFIMGVQAYISRVAKSSAAVQKDCASIVLAASEMLLLETEYLGTVDEKLITEVQGKYGEIDTLLEQAMQKSLNDTLRERLHDVDAIKQEQSNSFDNAAKTMRELRQTHAKLLENSHASDQILLDMVKNLTQEETELIMMGEDLNELKIALKPELKEYMVFSLNSMLNVADLIAFGNVEKFEQTREALLKNLALSQNNVKNNIQAVNEEQFTSGWDKVLEIQKVLLSDEEKLLGLWKQKKKFQTAADNASGQLKETAVSCAVLAREETARTQKQGNRIVFGGILVGALILAGLSFMIVRSIVKPLTAAVNLAEAIRAGDLSQRLNFKRSDELGQLSQSLDAMAAALEDKARSAKAISQNDLSQEVALASDKDTLGHALDTMAKNLNSMVMQIHAGASGVKSGASQISDASQSLSQGATEQAASLQEISASMTHISSQAKGNADSASQASKLSSEARNSSSRGNQQMQAMVEAMEAIQESSNNISKIIKVIDGIAFQTNLLALNAAVEAARAGKHGKGFAVVAQEVRSLAARSAKAAGETAQMIEVSLAKVQNGSEVADATSKILQEIEEGVAKVTELVGEIAAASNEQAQGVAQINVGLSQIDSVTQQNTANAEETAASSMDLNRQATELMNLLSRFKLREEDSDTESDHYEEFPVSEGIQRENHGGGWENYEQDQIVNPSQLINLDDGDFG